MTKRKLKAQRKEAINLFKRKRQLEYNASIKKPLNRYASLEGDLISDFQLDSDVERPIAYGRSSIGLGSRRYANTVSTTDRNMANRIQWIDSGRLRVSYMSSEDTVENGMSIDNTEDNS